MNKKTGGPAFPRPISTDAIANSGDNVLFQGDRPEWAQAQDGMTLRDWYAGKALPAVIPFTTKPEDAAKRSYSYADAMLKEREK